MEKTRSEALFEDYCRSKRIPCQKIIEGETKAPDYLTHLGSNQIVFEIKEINEIAASNAKDGGVWMKADGDHIRRKIGDGSKQLRSHCDKGFPCVLLVCDMTNLKFEFFTLPEDFSSAMYGAFTVNLSSDPKNGITARYLGGRRKFTESKPSSISAMARLRITGPDLQPEMLIYHNKFAKIKIDPSVFMEYNIPQFEIEMSKSDQPPEWVSINK